MRCSRRVRCVLKAIVLDKRRIESEEGHLTWFEAAEDGGARIISMGSSGYNGMSQVMHCAA